MRHIVIASCFIEYHYRRCIFLIISGGDGRQAEPGTDVSSGVKINGRRYMARDRIMLSGPIILYCNKLKASAFSQWRETRIIIVSPDLMTNVKNIGS
jgi:hypothetical protein